MDPVLLDLMPKGASDTVLDLYVPLLAEGGHLAGVRVRGAWYDLGRPDLYRETQLRLLPGRGRDRVLVHPDAEVDSAARLRRSVVGAAARVGPGARVERSVLWDGARVEGGGVARDAVVVSGGVVEPGEVASGVAVLPRRSLGRKIEKTTRVDLRGRMVWVGLK